MSSVNSDSQSPFNTQLPNPSPAEVSLTAASAETKVSPFDSLVLLLQRNAALDGISEERLQAFIRTVGSENALKYHYQKQFLQWNEYKLLDNDVTIRSRVYNDKLGHELTIQGKPGYKPAKYADPENLLKLHWKLQEIRENHISIKKGVSDTTQMDVGKILKKHGLGGQEGELLRRFANTIEKLSAFGPGFEKEQFIRVWEDFESERLKTLKVIKKGISFKTLCSKVISHSNYLRKRQIEVFRDELIAFVKREVPPLRLDPFRDIEDDINACRITSSLAHEYIQTVGKGSRGQRSSIASATWSEAASLPEYQADTEPLLKINPWAYVRKINNKKPKNAKKKCPTCVLTPEQAYAVLMELYRQGSPAFLPTLAEFTFGARPSEASCGLTRKHREHDNIQPIRISDFRFNKQGLFKMGVVLIKCQKTSSTGTPYREVDLSPSAYSFWDPIVRCFERCGLQDAPINTYGHSFVARERYKIYGRLGIRKYFAVKLGVDEKDVGREIKATADLGRHSFLTALYYHCVKTLKMALTHVREQAGHEDGPHTLESSYIGNSSPNSAWKYLYAMTAPIDLFWDPYLTLWKAKSRSNMAANLSKIREARSP